jgi:hypothetical protein
LDREKRKRERRIAIRAITETGRQHAGNEFVAIRCGVARVRRFYRVAISQCSARRHVARLCHSSRVAPFTNYRIITQHLGFRHCIACHLSRSLPRTTNGFRQRHRGPSHRMPASFACSSHHKPSSPLNNAFNPIANSLSPVGSRGAHAAAAG